MTRFSRSARAASLAGFVVLAFVGSAIPILAQEEAPSGESPFVVVDIHGGALLRRAGGAAILFPFGSAQSDDNLTKQRAVELQAGGGRGGVRVGGGMAWLTGPFGPDVLLQVTRTSDSPRGGRPRTTYLGLEAGYTLPLLRFSVGVARRVAGPSGPKGTVFTWEVGIRVPCL